MEKCNQEEHLLAYLEGAAAGAGVSSHIECCPSCRRELQIYRKLAEGLIMREMLMTPEQSDRNFALSELPLGVKELVAERKKKWMEDRVIKVLGAQGIKDKRVQQRMLKSILESPPEDLLKAAFPDDLTDDDDSD